MSKRKSTGKRQRFEIFKRDGFKCVYCGSSPVQKVLRVDHVVPVAAGGGNGPDNLVTSCFDCNAGKAAIPLDEKKLKIGFVRDEDREHAEQIKEYLALQRDIHGAKQDAANQLGQVWEQRLGPLSQNMASRFPGLMKDWPLEKLVEAIDITAKRLGPGAASYDYREALDRAKYFHGVLKRFRRDEEPPLPPAPPAAPIKEWSAHQRRAYAAVCAAIDEAGKTPEKYKDAESQLRLVYQAFSKAARGSEADCEWASGDAWNFDMVEVRGLTLEILPLDGGGSTYRIRDVEGFNPHEYAYEELHNAVNIGLYPRDEGRPGAEAMEDLVEIQGELSVWLDLYLEDLGVEAKQGALKSHLLHRADSPFMKRWGLV
jgi:hypothetical protein